MEYEINKLSQDVPLSITKFQSLFRGYSVRNNNKYKSERKKIFLDVNDKKIIHQHLHDTCSFFMSVPTAERLNTHVLLKMIYFPKYIYDCMQIRKNRINFLTLRSGNCEELSDMLYIKLRHDPFLSPEVKENLHKGVLLAPNDHVFVIIYKLKEGVCKHEVMYSMGTLKGLLFSDAVTTLEYVEKLTEKFDIKNSFVLDPWIKFINLNSNVGCKTKCSYLTHSNRRGFFGTLEQYQQFLKNNSSTLGFTKNSENNIPIKFYSKNAMDCRIEETEMLRLGLIG